MSATFHLLKTLELYLGKSCKIVYRDGGVSSPAKAFYGILMTFDQKFQIWEGGNERNPRKKFKVAFNHDDVSRIVLDLGGDTGA